MATPTQFRHYLISQDADGGNIEIARSSEQVGVLAFDSHRLGFVHCHVLLEPLENRRQFEDRARPLHENGHPLLARVLDFGEDEGSPFYITDNVDGETLRRMLARHPEIPVWLAAILAESSLAAFEALSECGDYVPLHPLDALRALQTGPRHIRVQLADFRLAEPANAIVIRNRQAKSAHEKQARFFLDYIREQSQNAPRQSGEIMLNRSDFAELLESLLLSCGPETRGAIGDLRLSLVEFTTAQPAGDFPANLKPRPLIGPLLATFQQVARSVGQIVRLQSQRLDAAQPYALRGTLMKSGQPIVVEQVPPARLSGIAPAEALRQARNLPKTGKFPNLVPVIFVEENEGVECVAETSVEGVTLGNLIAARGALDPQEIYLVLTGVDTALGQLEKAARATRRLRLEDIFLFTGFGKENARESGLLNTRLNEWPGFSIVLRGHPCLQSMTGRGTDPGIRLPVDVPSKEGSESIWNSAWFAALGCCMFDSGKDAGSADEEAIRSWLRDELERARQGASESRTVFLAKLARLMEEHGLPLAKSGNLRPEVSGSIPRTKQQLAQLAPVGSAAAALSPATRQPPSSNPAATTEDHEATAIGFAEALIHGTAVVKDDPPSTVPPDTGEIEFETYPHESSWKGFHEEQPVWIRVTTFAVGALITGALLAHMQGRAIWQVRSSPGPSPLPAPALPPPSVPEKRAPAKSKPPEKPPATAPTPEAKLKPPPNQPAAPNPEPLDERLRQLRLSGAGIPPEWRGEIENAAKNGNTTAMVTLGTASLRGDGGAVDERTAFRWFEKAVQAGDDSAMVSLAGCFLQGWGTPPDFSQAVSLLNRASAKGDGPAKDLLGVCYARGLGVARDDGRAFELVKQASEQGVPSAFGNLGAMYLRGQGVAADPVKATALFAEGSKKGHAESMLQYAQSLESGIGLPADPAEASRWYQQAARAGNAEATDWCERNAVKP